MTTTHPFAEPDGLALDPRYARLRREEPLARVALPYGGDAWLATRMDDVRTVLSDPRFSRAATVGADVPRVRPEIDHQPGSILNMDAPEHTRLRKLVARAFTVRRVEALRPRAAALTAQCLAGMRADGSPADLVTHLSVPLPVTIICELLGVPPQDREVFRAGADAALSTTSMTPGERAAARDSLRAYMAGLVAQRRVAPTDDLLGALVVARDDGEALSEEELVTLGIGILVAGHETTMNQIGNIVYALLTRPDRGDALRAGPDAVAPAIEELLRFLPLGASAGFPRVAVEDVELAGGTVRAGESVVVSTAAANRDPEVFDDAEELVLDRAENRHVAFTRPAPRRAAGADGAAVGGRVTARRVPRPAPGRQSRRRAVADRRTGPRAAGTAAQLVTSGASVSAMHRAHRLVRSSASSRVHGT